LRRAPPGALAMCCSLGPLAGVRGAAVCQRPFLMRGLRLTIQMRVEQ
jgi:hypothetical protein